VRTLQGSDSCRKEAFRQGLAAWRQFPESWAILAIAVARKLEDDPDLAEGAGGNLMMAVRKLLVESPGPEGNLLPLGERSWTADSLAEDPLLRAVFGEPKDLPEIFLIDGETDPDTGHFRGFSVDPDPDETETFWIRVSQGKNRGGVKLGPRCDALMEDYERANGGKAPSLGKGGLHPRLRCMAARICEVLATAPLSRSALEILPDRVMGILAMARIPILHVEAPYAFVPHGGLRRVQPSYYDNALYNALGFLAEGSETNNEKKRTSVMRMLEKEGATIPREVALHFLRQHPTSVDASRWRRLDRTGSSQFSHIEDSFRFFLEVLKWAPVKFGTDSDTDIRIAFHRDFCRGMTEWIQQRPEKLGEISNESATDSWRVQSVLRQIYRAPGVKPADEWADPLMEALRLLDWVNLVYPKEFPGIRTHGSVGDILAEWTGYLRDDDWEAAFQPRGNSHFPAAWYAAKSGLAMNRMATEEVYRIVAFNSMCTKEGSVPIPLLQGFLTAEIQRQTKKDLLVAVSREFLENAEDNLFDMEKLASAAKGPDGKPSAYTGAELLGIACGCGYPVLSRAVAERGAEHPECWHFPSRTARGRKVPLLHSLLSAVRFSYRGLAKPAGGPAEGARVLFCYLKKAEQIRDLAAISTIKTVARQVRYDPLLKEAENAIVRSRTARALETGELDRDEPIL
jgi:hypothetical protein